MKVLILYRPNSEHGRQVEQFIQEYQRLHQLGQIEVINVDTREGSAAASLYDVLQYPAILVIQDDGSIQHSWEGDSLPLMDELTAYLTA